MSTRMEVLATAGRLTRLRSLNGHQVNLALRDGSRLEGCRLVSIAGRGAPSIWLVREDMDMFVALDDVCDVWESAA